MWGSQLTTAPGAAARHTAARGFKFTQSKPTVQIPKLKEKNRFPCLGHGHSIINHLKINQSEMQRILLYFMSFRSSEEMQTVKGEMK